MARRVCVMVGLGIWLAAASPAAAGQHCESLLADCPLQSAQRGESSASSTQHSHKWWMSEASRSEFGLSDTQSRDIEAVFQQLLPTLRLNKADLDREEQALSRLLAEAPSNEGVVVQAIDRVEAARGALSKTRTLMLYRMYRLLSNEQRTKVQAYHERRADDTKSVRR